MERSHIKQEINITEPLMARINELISHYPADKKKSALLPVLHEVQDAHDNWLSIELQNKVAEILEILPIEVYEVVTFYTMLCWELITIFLKLFSMKKNKILE